MSTQVAPSHSPRVSLIKPQLQRLSGSGNTLPGVIVEHDLESPAASADIGARAGTKHVLVLPARFSGRLEWTSSGHRRESIYTPKDLILNPAGHVTAPRWDVPIELLLFAVEPEHFIATAEEAGATSRAELEVRFQFSDPLMEQLIRTLVSQFERGIPADRLYTESVAQTLLLHMIRRHTGANLRARPLKEAPSEPRVRWAVEFIHDHLSEPLSLAQIAREAGLNISQFSHVFKASMGVSPHQYVLRQRVERAIELLRETRLSIAEIAGRTGFADQSHMTRLMQQHRGFTPGEIRRSFR